MMNRDKEQIAIVEEDGNKFLEYSDFIPAEVSQNIADLSELLGAREHDTLRIQFKIYMGCHGPAFFSCSAQVNGVDVTDTFNDIDGHFWLFLNYEFGDIYWNLETRGECAANVFRGRFDSRKWWYTESEDNRYRFVLGEKGDRPLICVGVNPSIASPEHLDPTIRAVKRIAEANGYDGYAMVNASPERQTNPREMSLELPEWVPDVNAHALDDLMFYIAQLYENEPIPVWAAWGTNIEMRDYLAEGLQTVEKALASEGREIKWLHAGLTKNGHPRHPLYLPTTTKFEDFDFGEYIERI